MGRLGAHADAGGATYGFMNWFEKGEPGRPAPKAEAFFVNEKDRTWVDSKLTPQPTGPALQPIKLTGARDKVAKKTYIRAARYPQPTFDTALAECKADSSWRTFENNASGHDVMVDAPEWLTGILLQVSYRSYEARTVALHRRGPGKRMAGHPAPRAHGATATPFPCNRPRDSRRMGSYRGGSP